MKLPIHDRLVLLFTALLAAYQVAIGIDGLAALPIAAYTTGFGVLLVACLLLMILGLDVLQSQEVVIISTMLPLSLFVGLVSQYFPAFQGGSLAFAACGLLAVIITRRPLPGIAAALTLAVVHGFAGLGIFLLPLLVALDGSAGGGFALVGLGGALIGAGGLLLFFQKAGKPLLPPERLFQLFPGLLFLMTLCYVLGFALA